MCGAKNEAFLAAIRVKSRASSGLSQFSAILGKSRAIHLSPKMPLFGS